MIKKHTFWWKIFRWPVFLAVHPLLPILWIGYLFQDIWGRGIRYAIKNIYSYIKGDLRQLKYAWTFSLTGRDRWKEDAEEQRKRFMGAIEAKHSNRKKLDG